jgi:CheY-like chemotaxis protein
VPDATAHAGADVPAIPPHTDAALPATSSHTGADVAATTAQAGAMPGPASPAGTPDLPPGLYAHVTVRDSGQGMDAATLQRIFEPFFTTKPVGIGTGLGLSVVYGIMQAHGGAVRAESTPGRGSIFHLYFPGTAQAEPAGGPADAALPAGQGRSRRVMYIDDDEALAFLVSRLLERRGYAVSVFTNPAKALAALREAPSAFDLLVSDYNMPGLTGLDVARTARQIRADLPVAIASGFITDEMRAQAAALGIRDLIFKPNAVEEYCEVVDRLALDLER